MIFVDVGAHEGQTLEEAVRYRFDRIHAFEPMPAQFARLVERFGELAHVELINGGLADTTGPRPVYGTNDDMEASIYPDKEDVVSTHVTDCEFVDASEFIGALQWPIFLKLNCEGAEIPILHNLVDSGEIKRITSVLVDFDCQHVPGMEGEEAAIRSRLEEEGFYGLVTSADVVPRGLKRRAEGTYRYTRADEIMCWLKSHGIAER